MWEGSAVGAAVGGGGGGGGALGTDGTVGTDGRTTLDGIGFGLGVDGGLPRAWALADRATRGGSAEGSVGVVRAVSATEAVDDAWTPADVFGARLGGGLATVPAEGLVDKRHPMNARSKTTTTMEARPTRVVRVVPLRSGVPHATVFASPVETDEGSRVEKLA